MLNEYTNDWNAVLLQVREPSVGETFSIETERILLTCFHPTLVILSEWGTHFAMRVSHIVPFRSWSRNKRLFTRCPVAAGLGIVLVLKNPR